jgi:hypothetical protein
MDSDTTAPPEPVTIVYNSNKDDDDENKPVAKPVVNTQ